MAELSSGRGTKKECAGGRAGGGAPAGQAVVWGAGGGPAPRGDHMGSSGVGPTLVHTDETVLAVHMHACCWRLYACVDTRAGVYAHPMGLCVCMHTRVSTVILHAGVYTCV